MKRNFLVFSFIIIALSTFCFSACAKEKPIIPDVPIEEIPPQENETIDLDYGIILDGKREEEFYGDYSLICNEPRFDVTMNSWARVGEKGVYLFTQTNDKNICYSDDRDFFENDYVEFYIDLNPEYTKTLEALTLGNKVREDCLRICIDVCGCTKTFCGNSAENSWEEINFSVLTSTKTEKTEGYFVEAFIPYSSIVLNESIEKIGVMPAFNNSYSMLEAPVWFTIKGMNQNIPTCYALANHQGIMNIGWNDSTDLEITADWSDEKYEGKSLSIMEVNAQNEIPQTRAEIKTKLGMGGVYFLAKVYDKNKTHEKAFVRQNDYLEITIDTTNAIDNNLYKKGVFRFSIDVLGGFEVGVGVDGFNDFILEQRLVFTKVITSDCFDENEYDYQYTYIYEIMIPYTTMEMKNGIPFELNFSWAIYSPSEEAYVLDNFNEQGELLNGAYLWLNNHNPYLPKEYFTVNYNGIDVYDFPIWRPWETCIIQAAAKERYNYRGFLADEGLYLNVVQYVDHYIRFGDLWSEQTHIELEIKHLVFGDETIRVSLFPDDVYRIADTNALTDIKYHVTATKDINLKTRFYYEISYELYLGFGDVLETDYSNASVRFMSYTPLESAVGYENAVQITREDQTYWTDDCLSYKINKIGIYEMEESEDNSSLPTIYALCGEVKLKEGKIHIVSNETTAIFEDFSLSCEGSYELNVSVQSEGSAGIVFGCSLEGDSITYYYFYIKNKTSNDEAVWLVELVEFSNGFSKLIHSDVLSGNYDSLLAYSMKVEVFEGKYYCYFANELYFVDKMSLYGEKIGISAEYAGSHFFNINVSTTNA